MKGSLIATIDDLSDKPELIEVLSRHSENVVQKNQEIHFYSKDGALMTMICALLDLGVPYRLELDRKAATK